MNFSDGVYKGEVKNGKRNGYGFMNFKNGDKFEGCYKDDIM
jgi:hypothetical protein